MSNRFIVRAEKTVSSACSKACKELSKSAHNQRANILRCFLTWPYWKPSQSRNAWKKRATKQDLPIQHPIVEVTRQILILRSYLWKPYSKLTDVND